MEKYSGFYQKSKKIGRLILIVAIAIVVLKIMGPPTEFMPIKYIIQNHPFVGLVLLFLLLFGTVRLRKDKPLNTPQNKSQMPLLRNNRKN